VGRRLALCSLGAGLLASAEARAEDARPLRSVVIITPAPASCVLADPLLVGIMNAGPFFASLVPASSVPETIPAPTFQLEGTPQSLHVRAWGLSSSRSQRQTRPELEQVLSDQSCETVTEAVVAEIVSLLTPEDTGFEALLVEAPPSGAATAEVSASEPRALEQLLHDAQRELAPRPELSASVFATTVGLELAVQGERARCRRATWLQLSHGSPELGMSVAELTRAVDDCLASLPPDAPPSARTSEPGIDGAFHLAMLAGSLAVSIGLINGLVVADGSTSTLTALVYGAAPPVLGGVASYVVGPRWSEPVLLAGFWLGVAGTSTVVGTESGASKTLLVGASLAAGSATSAALALINGFIDDPSRRIAPWAVATPAVVGAGLGAATLMIDGRGRHATSLALFGGAAASLPLLWLAGVALFAGDESPVVDVGVAVEDLDAPRLVLHGEF
jgi:hypothetical protein